MTADERGSDVHCQQSAVNSQQSRVRVLHWQPARVEGSRTIYAAIDIDGWLVIRGVTCWEGRKQEAMYQLPANVEIHDTALLLEAKDALAAAYYDSVDAVTLLLRE